MFHSNSDSTVVFSAIQQQLVVNNELHENEYIATLSNICTLIPSLQLRGTKGDCEYKNLFMDSLR